MRMHLLVVLALLPFLVGWGDREPAWPYAEAMPDEPVPVPDARYAPVDAGTKSYRPVEPLPWGGVNQRVAPGKSPSDIPEKHEGP